MKPIRQQGTHNFTRTAKDVRNSFKDYFNSDVGSVSWQDRIIDSTSSPFDEEY